MYEVVTLKSQLYLFLIKGEKKVFVRKWNESFFNVVLYTFIPSFKRILNWVLKFSFHNTFLFYLFIVRVSACVDVYIFHKLWHTVLHYLDLYPWSYIRMILAISHMMGFEFSTRISLNFLPFLLKDLHDIGRDHQQILTLPIHESLSLPVYVGSCVRIEFMFSRRVECVH